MVLRRTISKDTRLMGVLNTIKREISMTEAEAKGQLSEMLDDLTVGSVLHLLAEIFTEEAASTNDAEHAQRCRQVEHTLFVVGLGLDAVLPI